MRPALRRLLGRVRAIRRVVAILRRVPVFAVPDRVGSGCGPAWRHDVPAPESLDVLQPRRGFGTLCQETLDSSDVIPRLAGAGFAAPPHEWEAGLHEHTDPLPIPAWSAILERASLGVPTHDGREER